MIQIIWDKKIICDTLNCNFVKHDVCRTEKKAILGFSNIHNQNYCSMKGHAIVLMGMQGFLMSSSQSF